MSGLVDEIQREALDARTSISTLIRKVKLAAVKLSLPHVEAWVESELNGYDDQVPAYRTIHGVPRAKNPMRGWIPIHLPAQFAMQVSEVVVRQPLSEIEDLIARDGMLHMPMNPHMIDLLNDLSRVPFAEMSIFIQRSVLIGILDRVRNMALDWAIELERTGIKGESMSFKNEEKAAAQGNPAINIGSVGTLVGVVGNHNRVRDIVGGDLNVSQTRDLAQQLHENHANLEVQAQTRNHFQ
jgi:hypothetical protein